jgi:hypothetical protein
MSEPFWLRNDGVQQLLHFLTDRLDRADADGKPMTRALKLNTSSFPALYRAEYESEKEQLWSYLEQLAARGWLRLKLDRAQPGKAKYELNPRVEILDEQCIRAAVGRATRQKSSNELWRDAVFSHLEATDEVRETVSRFLVNIPGRTASEIVLRLNEINHLRDETLLLREVSARVFWGQSKVLDERQTLVAAILDVEECPFPEMPVQLQVFLPNNGFEGALFIENLATFEQATRDSSGEFAGLALIFASGFKGSAKRLRSRAGASLYFASNGALDARARTKFESWLFDRTALPSWFWGDLDYSGMGILKSLRTTFLELQGWQTGYEPMLASLKAGNGHAPEHARKRAQRPVDVTGCDYADTLLLPAIHSTGRFIDQELGW